MIKRTWGCRRSWLALSVTLTLINGSAALAAEKSTTTETASSAGASAPTTESTSDNSALPIYDLGDTIITASRITESISEVPANVTVITAEELAKRNFFSLRDALSREAGIYVSPSADIKNGLTLRGMTGPDILALYNGQPINDSFDGAINWDSIPLEEIERIEIVRGAASSLYGGNAVAGVINIITKKAARDGIHGSANFSVGSRRTIKRGININGGDSKHLSFRLGYEKRTTDGWAGYFINGRETTTGPATATGTLPKSASGAYLVGSRGNKSKYNDNITMELKYDFDDSKSLTYNYMHADYKYRYNNPFTYLRDASGNPAFGGKVDIGGGKFIQSRISDYLGYHGERGQDVHNLSYADKDNGFKVSIGYNDVYKNGYSSASSTANSLDWSGAGTRSSYPGQKRTLELQKTWELGQHTLLAGTAWSRDEMTYRVYNLARWRDHSSITATTSQSGGEINSLAFFIQDGYAFADKWKANLGFRYDKFDKKNGYSLVTGVYTAYNSTSFDSVSPKLALSYEPQEDMLIFASFGKSFNPPSIYKLYRRAGTSMSSIQANPHLKPETSKTVELGIKQQLNDKTSYSVTLFDIHTDDKITIETIGGVRAYYNLYKGEAHGAELELRHRINTKWQTYANYTFESAKLKQDGVTTRDWYIPKHLFHTGIEYTYENWNAVLDGQYVSKRQRPDAVTGEYGSEDAFFTANFFLNYKINDDFKLRFGIENIFNRQFYASEAVNERAYTLGVQYDF